MLIGLPVIAVAWFINSRPAVELPNADSAAPPAHQLRTIEVGGVQRPAPHPMAETIFGDKASYGKRFVAKLNEDNKKGIRVEPPNKKLTKGMNANVDSVIEAFETGELSLYDLISDIGETTEVSDRQPAKVAELHAMLKAWRERVGADPMRPNPEFVEK